MDKIKELYELIGPSYKDYFSNEDEFRSFVDGAKDTNEIYQMFEGDVYFADVNEFNSAYGDLKKKESTFLEGLSSSFKGAAGLFGRLTGDVGTGVALQNRSELSQQKIKETAKKNKQILYDANVNPLEKDRLLHEQSGLKSAYDFDKKQSGFKPDEEIFKQSTPQELQLLAQMTGVDPNELLAQESRKRTEEISSQDNPKTFKFREKAIANVKNSLVNNHTELLKDEKFKAAVERFEEIASTAKVYERQLNRVTKPLEGDVAGPPEPEQDVEFLTYEYNKLANEINQIYTEHKDKFDELSQIGEAINSTDKYAVAMAKSFPNAFAERVERIARSKEIDDKLSQDWGTRENRFRNQIIKSFSRNIIGGIGTLAKVPAWVLDSDPDYSWEDKWGDAIDATSDSIMDNISMEYPTPEAVFSPIEGLSYVPKEYELLSTKDGKTKLNIEAIPDKLADAFGFMLSLYAGAGAGSAVAGKLPGIITGTAGSLSSKIITQSLPLFTSSYAQSFPMFMDEMEDIAQQTGVSIPQGDMESAAHSMATVVSALEFISPNFGYSKPALAERVIKNIADGTPIKRSVGAALKEGLLEVAKEGVQEISQLLGENAVKAIYNADSDTQTFNLDDDTIKKQLLETLIVTPLAVGPSAAGRARSAFRSSMQYKDAVSMIAANPNEYIPKLQKEFERQGTNPEYAAQVLEDIKGVQVEAEVNPLAQKLADYNFEVLQDIQAGGEGKVKMRTSDAEIAEYNKNKEVVDKQAERLLSQKLRSQERQYDVDGERLFSLDGPLVNFKNSLSSVAPVKFAVAYSDVGMLQLADRLGIDKKDVASSNGFYDRKTGVVAVNAGKMQEGVQFHEWGHPIVDAMITERPEVLEGWYNQIKDQYRKGEETYGAWANAYYSGDRLQQEEAVVQYLADVAEGKFDQNETLLEKAKSFIGSIMEALGIASPEIVSPNQDIHAVADSLAKSLKKGRAIRLGSKSKKTPTDRVAYASNQANAPQDRKTQAQEQGDTVPETIFYHATNQGEEIRRSGFIPIRGDRSMAAGVTAPGIFLYPNDPDAAKKFTSNMDNGEVIPTSVSGNIYDANAQQNYGWENDLQITEIAGNQDIIQQLKNDGFSGVTSTELGTPVTFVFNPSTVKLVTNSSQKGDTSFQRNRKLNRTAKRVAVDTQTHLKDLQQDIIQNPDDYSYDTVNISDEQNFFSQATDTKLQSMVDNATSANSTTVLAAIELINRKSARGEDMKNDFKKLRELGTGAGQILRFLGELKTTTPVGIANYVMGDLADANVSLSIEDQLLLTTLSENYIKSRDNVTKAQEDLFNNPTENNYTALDVAQQELTKSYLEINKFIGTRNPRGLDKTILALIQGNLLVPSSHLVNLLGNTISALPRLAENTTIGLTYDVPGYVARRGAGGAATAVEALFGAMLNAIQGGWRGTKKGISALWTGNIADPMKFEGRETGLHPIDAWRQLLTAEGRKTLPRDKRGNVPGSVIAEKMLEAIGGPGAEINFRLLALGDSPFRISAYQAEAYRVMKRLGGDDFRLFFATDLRPLNKEMEEAAMKEYGKDIQDHLKSGGTIQSFLQQSVDEYSRRATFSNEGTLAKFAQSIVGAVETGIDKLPEELIGMRAFLKTAFRTTTPYVRVPSNIIEYLAEFAVPAFAVTKGAVNAARYAKTGNADHMRNAQRSVVRFLIGQSMVYLADQLFDAGVIVGSAAGDDDKERTLKYAMGGPNRINYSALVRYMNGTQDPSNPYQEGDETKDLSKFGIFGMLIAQRAEFNEMIVSQGMTRGDLAVPDRVTKQMSSMLGTSLEMSFLQGSMSILQSLRDQGMTGTAKGFDRLLSDMADTGTAIIIPNTVSVVTRGQREYILRTDDENALKRFEEKFVAKFRPKLEDNVAGVYPVLSIWGEPVKQSDSETPMMSQLFGIDKARVVSDPLSVELLNVAKTTGEIPVTIPEPNIGLIDMASQQKSTYKLTERDYLYLQQLTGEMKRMLLVDLVNSEEWNTYTDDIKYTIFERVNQEANESARDIMISNLQRSVMDGKVILDPIKRRYSYLDKTAEYEYDFDFGKNFLMPK